MPPPAFLVGILTNTHLIPQIFAHCSASDEGRPHGRGQVTAQVPCKVRSTAAGHSRREFGQIGRSKVWTKVWTKFGSQFATKVSSKVLMFQWRHVAAAAVATLARVAFPGRSA